MKKGSKHTEESKKKMSEAQKGRKHSEVAKRRMSEANKGRVFSKEHRKKLSEARKGKHVGDPVTRFWSNVNKSTRPNECWPWTGHTPPRPHNYGAIYWDGHRQQAHRVSWQIANGKIPHGIRVLHSCDNKLCVNPEHLFLGTQKDNAADAQAKGRLTVGVAHHAAKLNDKKVKEIRRRAASGTLYRELSTDFGVTDETIGLIVRRKSWKHVK